MHILNWSDVTMKKNKSKPNKENKNNFVYPLFKGINHILFEIA